MTTETRISTAALLLIAIFACFVDAYETYEIPQPKFKLLKPKGFQFSIPDESGIQLFAFHGNLNKKMEKMDRGQFSADTISKQNGKWIYENPKLKVRSGDVIYYWLFVIKNGVGYRLDDGIYEISDSEIYHTNKKVHKLRKRTAYNGHGRSYGYYIPSNLGYYHHRIPGPSAPSEYNDEPHFGHDYGHGYPHHHERDFPRGHLNNGHVHGHNQGHGFGHHHHWGHNHKHNHDCNWGEENNSEESTTSNESNLEENQSTDNSEINTGSEKVTTDEDSEMIETTTTTTTTTTTDVPPIDIRFGETN